MSETKRHEEQMDYLRVLYIVLAIGLLSSMSTQTFARSKKAKETVKGYRSM